MATCCGSYLPVKSSVYNQTGENFFQQLGVYNHMNTHLRRVFQAKCVVDSKNPRYVQRQDNYNYYRGGKCLHKCQSHDNISRSARDSQSQLIGSTKSLASFKNQNHERTKNSMGSRRNPLSRQEIHGSKPVVHVVEPKRLNNYTNEQSDYESSFEGSTNISDNRFSPSKTQKSSKNKRIKLEKLKYLKFLHEITQEIIKNGFHRDEDIKNVFKKHLTENLSILSKKKMVKKLRELKSSLNISDSEDDHDEDEESDGSSEKSYSEKNGNDAEESKKSDDDKYDYDSDDSNASQVSEESIQSQSEIQSVINDDDSSSENNNPLT